MNTYTSITIFFIYVWLSYFTVTANNNFPKGSRIIGGQAARAGQFPWQAAIYLDNTSGKYFCGGSLITSEWILTAAHCVYGVNKFTIHLGSNTLFSPDQNRIILATSTYVLHPEYNQTTLEKDVGLIKLHMAVTFTDYIQPIAITDLEEIADGLIGITTGWGQTSDSAAGINNQLEYVSLSTISNAECQITYGNQITSGMICAVGNYNEGICIGDTGGPLVISGSNGKPILIAVASFMSQNGYESTDPTGYTRLGSSYDWIRNVTGIEKKNR